MANSSTVQKKVRVGAPRWNVFGNSFFSCQRFPWLKPQGQVYGKIRADLEFRGEMIGNNDLWIAAHAIAEHFVLVTNNEKEFSGVRGLKLQNWVA
jgi:predicted nucleic acid-binding protein